MEFAVEYFWSVNVGVFWLKLAYFNI